MAVLRGLKDYNDLDISVIVSMTDDGGSNAVIRDEFGILPLSDLRKSILALSEVENGILRKLFVYRFHKGKGLSGHTVGNLMMMALTDITGSEIKAIEATKKLFRVKGKVIPVTLQHTALVAEYETGQKIKGEHLIDEPSLPHKLGRIISLSLFPKVKANPEAVRALITADFIIAGPGDLYTTTLASMIVPGISAAMKKNKGKFIYISNLMTKYGQTSGMSANDLVSEMERYASRKPNVVIVHKGNFPKNVLKKYAAQGEKVIFDDLEEGSFKVKRSSLIIDREIKREKGDKLVRSLIRHDSNKLGKTIYKIISGQ